MNNINSYIFGRSLKLRPFNSKLEMVSKNELRIGNFVLIQNSNKIYEVEEILSNSLSLKSSGETAFEIGLEKVYPIEIKSIINSLIEDANILYTDKEENIFYFSNQRPTYFLVEENENTFFIGMLDLNIEPPYRRVCRPFNYYHKLQNAYQIIYDKDIDRIT